MPDVIEVLTRDHREVEEMFQTIEALQARATLGESLIDERRDITDKVIIELVRHAVAEEQHLYPATREHIPGGDELADHELEEHAEAEKLMKQLDGMSPDNIEYGSLVTRLIADVRHHIQEEETQLFSQLRAHASQDELDRLGEAIESAKKLAPTRPHPAAPDRPPFNKLLAPGAALVDRIRDKLTGRGKD